MVKTHRRDAKGNRPFAPSLVSNSQSPKESLPGAGTALKSFSRLRQHSPSVACGIFVLLLAMFTPGSLSAQGSTGRISGHVADSTGAAIPDATVTLTNTATSGVRTTVSTNSGDYTFSAVSIGTYVLKAEHQGFKTASSA